LIPGLGVGTWQRYRWASAGGTDILGPRPRNPVALRGARKFVAGKVAATVSAQPRAGRRFATMAKIESKQEMRLKVREAQANRERLKRESEIGKTWSRS
jgi:hypothetical protein